MYGLRTVRSHQGASLLSCLRNQKKSLPILHVFLFLNSFPFSVFPFKANEKAIFRPDEMPDLVLPQAALVESVSGGAHLTVEGAADLLTQFKRLMREDPADFKLHAPTKKGGRKRQGENADAAGGAGVDESMPLVMREAAEKTKAAVRKANSGKGKASAAAAGAKKKKVSKAKAKKKKVSGGDSDDDEEGVDSGADSDYGG